MEGDPANWEPTSNQLKFQSTPSVWRETQIKTYPVTEGEISIHSLRMEGDGFDKWCFSGTQYFNPLPPYGGRLISVYTGFPGSGISIHSLRMEGDVDFLELDVALFISIHSLRMEGDLICLYLR